MLFVLLFFIELLILFVFSKTLTNLLFAFFYKTTKNKKLTIYSMSILFWPGTLIHELSHAFMGILLQVPIGRMEFMPKLVNNILKLGSVEIAKTDPIRRILIGTAPFFFGTSILLGIFFYAVQNDLFSYQSSIIVIGYLVFEIGNTMFSSKKDMEGALEVIVALIAISIIFYIVGFRISAFSTEVIFSNPIIIQTFQKADIYLATPIGIDLVIIFLLKLLKY